MNDDDLFDFMKRGLAAQRAVDKAVRLDAVGTTGGKATVETYLVPPKPKDSREKIRLKAGPKQYKTGAGLTGQNRLQRRVNSLLLAASRLAKKSQEGDEAAWAERLVDTLMSFNAEMQRDKESL